MVRQFRPLTLAALLLLFATASAANEEYVRLDTRPGVVQELLVIKVDNPRAAVILLPGGDGIVNVSADGPGKNGNFLVRSRRRFADDGLMVVLMDAASDWKQRDKGLKGKRLTDKHVRDIEAVISWVRQQVKVPVWLVGTSRGTISAVHAAVSLGREKGPDGLVLTASVTEPGKKNQATVFDAHPERVTQPVVLVHHKEDACKASPPAGARRFQEALKGAAKAELVLVSGGTYKSGQECKGHSLHGFYNIEAKVTSAISQRLTSKYAAAKSDIPAQDN